MIGSAMSPLDTDVAIETPEHIVFHYRLAGPARRAIAQVIDLLIVGAAFVVISLLVILIFVGSSFLGEIGESGKAAGGVILVIAFVAQWGYFLVLEAWKGR